MIGDNILLSTHYSDISETPGILKPKDSSEFDQNLNFLKNKLAPDNLIRVLDRTSDLNSAVRIFKWASRQKSFHHTSNTYFRIILKLGMAGKVLEMRDFCEYMVKDRCPGAEEALVALVHTFVGHRRIKEAIVVLVNMNLGGYRPPIEVFNVLLGALVGGESRDFQSALFVYKEMVKACVLPTVDILNYLLEVLFATNRNELALHQFRRMNNKGCDSNSKTFEILVKGLIESGRVDEAATVLEQMLKHKWKINEAIMFLEDTQVHETAPFNRLLEGCCNASEVLAANVLLETMSERNIADCQSWNILIRWLCEEMLILKMPLKCFTICL
ncbi:Pentatricopeptide repeat-containing protein [Glycine max]|nr:Pentatricopeptide repeat-containing protein [Glycine max]